MVRWLFDNCHFRMTNQKIIEKLPQNRSSPQTPNAGTNRNVR